MRESVEAESAKNAAYENWQKTYNNPNATNADKQAAGEVYRDYQKAYNDTVKKQKQAFDDAMNDNVDLDVEGTYNKIKGEK